MAKSLKLGRPIISAINKELDALCKKYYKSIPLDAIESILRRYGVVLLQEDGTEWEGFFTGSKGRASFDLGDIETMDEHKTFQRFEDTMLVLTWYRMESGNYEIVAYLS